ncbi:7409_t:CDS:2 [Entrophospora sp. SA101]|nr:7409_t:CDS:2 [Entrophospora sp. SA101]
MRAAVKWIDYDLDKTYDIMIAFPDLQLPLHVNNRGQTKIAVCSSCKSTKNHHFPPTLVVIPEEIIAVPMKHQKHLSPIHMSCSLGQASSETLLPELATPKKTSEHDWSDSPSNSRFKHKRSKHPGKKQRTTTTSNSQDYVDLLVFGYEAKLFRDDDMSQKVNNGDLLIPWRGEIENKILLDRYDVRNLLDDRDQFKKVTYTLSRKSEEIQQEKLCEEERWADLDSEAEDLYEMSEEERDIYTEEKRKRKKTKEENKEYEYRYIPKFTVPQGMLTPSSKRIDEIIERTAKFLNDSSDPQMEIVIQAKQANNPSFSFLNKDDSLYPYYKHIRLLLQTGLFAYGNNKENVPSEVSAKDINENKKIDERAQYEESSTAQEQISSTSSVGSNIITNNTTNTNSTTTTLTHNTQKQSRPTI